MHKEFGIFHEMADTGQGSGKGKKVEVKVEVPEGEAPIDDVIDAKNLARLMNKTGTRNKKIVVKPDGTKSVEDIEE